MYLRTIIIAATCFLTARPVAAQRTGAPPPAGPTIDELRGREEAARRVAVTVALVEQMPTGTGDAPAVLLRRSGGGAHDVILLRRADASGARLASAIQHLMVIRERDGDTARVTGTFRLPTATRAPRAWERTEQVRAERVIVYLRKAAPIEVPGVGRVPAKELYLPSRTMREAARQSARGSR